MCVYTCLCTCVWVCTDVCVCLGCARDLCVCVLVYRHARVFGCVCTCLLMLGCGVSGLWWCTLGCWVPSHRSHTCMKTPAPLVAQFPPGCARHLLPHAPHPLQILPNRLLPAWQTQPPADPLPRAHGPPFHQSDREGWLGSRSPNPEFCSPW